MKSNPTNAERADRAARKAARDLGKYLPAGFGGAVIAVTPELKIVMHENMNADVLARVLAQLTEAAVKKCGAPIASEERGINGANEEKGAEQGESEKNA